MSLPKRQHSKQRGRKRRTHQKVAMPNLVTCTHCKQLKISNRVCPKCGYHKGKPVVEIKVKEKKPKR